MTAEITPKAAHEAGRTYYQHLLTVRPKPLAVPQPVKSCNESLIIDVSDIHFGQVNARDGKVVFDSAIAKQYLQEFSRQVIRLAKYYISRAVVIDEIVIVLGGDIVDGDSIYSGHAMDVDSPALEQVRRVVDPLWQFAISLQKALPKIKKIRYEGVPGNHGRVASVRDNYLINNWDSVVYWSLSILAARHAGISINYSDGYYHNFVVKGWPVHIRHIGSMGAWTPAQRAKVQGWQLDTGARIMMFHHWHESGWQDCRGPITWNGCFCGTTNYAERLGFRSTPRQWVFGLNSKRITYRYEVDFMENGQ